MRVYYDLHIHSALSPCGDESMTPNNILNMCMLKKLNLISITDHNSYKQYNSIEKIKDSYDFLLIYGAEITVSEGFHVLAYFENMDLALLMDQYIEENLDKNIMFSDMQIILDEYDNVINHISYALNQRTKIPYKDLCLKVHQMGGLIVLSHVERKYGILEYSNDFYEADGVESTKGIKYDGYKTLMNSDAHDLVAIRDNINYLELDELSFQGFKRWLKNE